MICDFTSFYFSTFQLSFEDDRLGIMKGCVSMEPRFFTSGRAHTRDQQINSFENWET